MEAGLDVMVEKPIAHTLEAARALVDTAERHQRILQIGHLERFNPAVIALAAAIGKPLFFEIHRLSEFSPRCLDVDVVLDLMIHDVDIILALTGERPRGNPRRRHPHSCPRKWTSPTCGFNFPAAASPT